MKHVLLKLLCFFLPKRKFIIFESSPECDGSPWMIYREMLRRIPQVESQCIWAVDKNFTTKNKKLRIESFFGDLSWKDRLKRHWIVQNAILIVESNRFIPKQKKSTLRIYTRHGGCIKNTGVYASSIGDVDYILTLSEKTMQMESLNVYTTVKNPEEKFLITGFPCNDKLFEPFDLFANGFWLRHIGCQRKFDRIIGWLPTYRQHSHDNAANSKLVFPFGLPIIKTEDELSRLNEFLRQKNILLAVQMHHSQQRNFPIKKLSNVVLISQDIKYELGVSNFNLISNFDALITDYSGVYHEYALLDRPIAISIDDYEDYSVSPGFVLDFFDWIKGVYLKQYCDLINFIKEVSEGVDSAKSQRQEAIHLIHKYIDNQSTNRVVDFIFDKVDFS